MVDGEPEVRRHGGRRSAARQGLRRRRAATGRTVWQAGGRRGGLRGDGTARCTRNCSPPGGRRRCRTESARRRMTHQRGTAPTRQRPGTGAREPKARGCTGAARLATGPGDGPARGSGRRPGPGNHLRETAGWPLGANRVRHSGTAARGGVTEWRNRPGSGRGGGPTAGEWQPGAGRQGPGRRAGRDGTTGAGSRQGPGPGGGWGASGWGAAARVTPARGPDVRAGGAEDRLRRRGGGPDRADGATAAGRRRRRCSGRGPAAGGTAGWLASTRAGGRDLAVAVRRAAGGGTAGHGGPGRGVAGTAADGRRRPTAGDAAAVGGRERRGSGRGWCAPTARCAAGNTCAAGARCRTAAWGVWVAAAGQKMSLSLNVRDVASYSVAARASGSRPAKW